MHIKRNTYFKIIVVSLSVFLALLVSEFFFGSGKEGGDKISYKRLNDSINEYNKQFASKNPYGFTDYDREKEKPDSIFRIVVMGDSYIWGDGLAFEKTWGHKLGRKINERFKNVETLSWGKNGWSIRDEYQFFIETGYQYHADLLLFGFGHNDPDMGIFKHLDPIWYKRLGFMYKVFPQLTGKVLDYFYNRSYEKWVNKLYTPENLDTFEVLLHDVKLLEKKYDLNIAFIMTPRNLHPDYNTFFPKIEVLFNNQGLRYINLFPLMQETFATTPPDSMMANPANGHPGDKVTEFYADEALRFIISEALLDTIGLIKTELR